MTAILAETYLRWASADVGFDNTFEFRQVPCGQYLLVVLDARGEAVHQEFVSASASEQPVTIQLANERAPCYSAVRMGARMNERVAVCVVASLGLIACGPKGLSDAGYVAAQKAVDAINRAYEYRDKGAIYYEPRYLDAQRAVSDIPALDETGPEARFKGAATACVMRLEGYRLTLDLRLRLEDEQTKHDLDGSYYEAAKCVRDLPGVLYGLSRSRH